MKKVFNCITRLMIYFDLLIETEEAAELMKREVKTKTYQRDRCVRLRNECVKIHDHLFLTFNYDLNELNYELATEISKTDAKGQDLLFTQIHHLINEFHDKVNRINKTGGFSTESIGKKSSKIMEETAVGSLEEKDIEFDFSIAFLANDLYTKFNHLQTLIDERFKFLKSERAIIKEKGSEPSKLTYLLKLYYEKGSKDLNTQQVNKLADDVCIARQTLRNRWIKLKADRYTHNGNTNNIKEFVNSYEALMVIFKDNINAFNDVKNRYDQLKETYPELTY